MTKLHCIQCGAVCRMFTSYGFELGRMDEQGPYICIGCKDCGFFHAQKYSAFIQRISYSVEVAQAARRGFLALCVEHMVNVMSQRIPSNVDNGSEE